MLSYLVAAAAALALPSLAAINPTSPDSSTVVKVGDDITALWTADTTGQWTNLEIQLMTGPNLDMVPLSVLGQGIDGTTKTSFSAPAPAVSPYSQIYFLQFTQGGNVSTALWSTRFTIAGPDGSTTPPTNTTTWNGQAVQWGTGVLTGGSSSSNSTSGSGTAVATSTEMDPDTLTGLSTSTTSTGAAINAVTSISASTMASSSTSASAASAASQSAKHSGSAGKGMAVGGGAMLFAVLGWFL